jgi:hypothetical protein
MVLLTPQAPEEHPMNTKSRIFAVVSVVICAFSSASIAHAEDTTTTTTAPGVPTTIDVQKQMEAMQKQYQSATAAMMSLYANQASPMVVQQSLGGGNLSAMSLESMLQTPGSIDSTIQAKSKTWADQLAAFRAQSSLGTVQFSAEWQKVTESMGAMTAAATADIAATAPMSLSALRSGSGTLTDAALWKAALKGAGMSGTKIPGVGGDACIAAMMAAASSGDPKAAAAAGKGCTGGASACIASGLYFHNQLRGVASGGAKDPGVLPPADFNQLQPWQRDAIAGAAPSVTGGATASTGGSCGAQAAVSATTNKVVPGAWGALGSGAGAATNQGTIPSGWGGLGR